MHGVSWEEGTSFPFVKHPAGFISPLQSLLLQAPLFKPPLVFTWGLLHQPPQVIQAPPAAPLLSYRSAVFQLKK